MQASNNAAFGGAKANASKMHPVQADALDALPCIGPQRPESLMSMRDVPLALEIRPLLDPDEADALIESWAQRRSSPQVYAEIVLADVMGHTPGDPSPLQDWLPPWPEPKPPSKPKHRFGKVPPHIKSQAKAVNILNAACWLGLGSPIKQATDEYSVICPFHEDSSPSLCLNSAKGVYFCHPCGEGGDILKLVQLVLGLNFPEAVAWLLAPSPTAQKKRLAE